MRQGTKVYFAANLVSQAAALIRFIVLARLLGAEELGLAAMIILTSQFFQSVSDTGSERYLVQDRDGDKPEVQGVIHLVLAGRGVLIALALILFAQPVASLYHAPFLAESLRWLALAPLISGVLHLDFRRLQRTGDFRPESAGMIVSETLSLVVTAAAAWVLRDHSAVVWGLVARAAGLMVMSHVTAKRPYRWAIDREQGVRFSLYAMPLFLNGFLLFFGQQGDRVVVGSGLGAAALGHYSAILLLIFYPAALLGRFITGISLPQLAGARDDPAAHRKLSERLGGRTVILSVSMAAGFAVVAPFATPILYSQAFAQPLQIFALLGVLQASRFLRLWTTTLAGAIGKSTIILINNVARMVALPIAIYAHWQFRSLEAIAIAFIFGEVAATLTALWMLAREGSIDLRRELVRVTAYVGMCAVIIAAAWTLQDRNLVGLGAAVLAGAVATAIVVRTEWASIAELVKIARARLPRIRSA